MPQTTSMWERRFDYAVLVLLALCLAAFALHCIVAYDVWWQLATGAWVRQHGWPQTDPFSYGFPGRVWIEMRWLYCVVISLIFEKLGLNALILAKCLWLLLTGAVLWRVGAGKARWAVHLGLFCALLLAHQRLVLRPELVTYCFLAVTLLCLRRYQVERRRVWLYALPLLQVAWTNSHTLWALGPIVTGLFAGAEWLAGKLPGAAFRDEKNRVTGADWHWLCYAAGATALACLVNPYGWRGIAFAYQLFTQIQSNHVLSGLITEFRSPLAGAGLNLFFVSYVGVAALSAAGFVLRRRSLSLSWLALWGAFFYLSTLAERNVPLFGIVAGACIMLHYGDLTWQRAAWAARVACAGFALVMIPALASNAYHRATDPDRRFGVGVAERRFPLRAMAFVEAEKLPRPVLHTLGESAYGIFTGGPRSVYADGRLEVYGGDIINQAVQTLNTGANLTATTEQLNVYTAIVNHEKDTGLLLALLRDTAWTAVYYDSSHVIFLRQAPATQDTVARLKIDWQNPVMREVAPPAQVAPRNWLAGWWPQVAENAAPRALGELFLKAGNVPKAQSYFEEALRLWPDEPRTCLQLGVLYRAQQREAEAAPLLARVPATMLNEPEAQIFAATTYEAYNNLNAATDAWQAAANAGARTPYVFQNLARAAIAVQRYDAAYFALDELSKFQPNDAKIWTNLGLAADKLNRKADALRALTRAAQLQPNDAKIWTQIGVIKRETGDAAGARQAFQRALSVDPSFQPAQLQLNNMGP